MSDLATDIASGKGGEAVPVDFLTALGPPIQGNKSPENDIDRKCPLCKSAIRYFFVNFNEKVLLCENQDCEFPFGYEDLDFVKQDEQWGIDDELESITTVISRPTQCSSIISTNAWSDIEKLNTAYDSEDSQAGIIINRDFETDAEKEAKLKEYLREKEAETQAKKNVQQIKKLNIQLQNTYEEEASACIKNEKWIRHLAQLQDLSGVQLLKKQEIARLKKEDAALHSNELTIGINSTSVTIEILPKAGALEGNST